MLMQVLPSSSLPAILVVGSVDHALEASFLGHARVVRAHDAYEALALAEREAFALVVTPVSMPGMSGFEVAAGVLRNLRNRHARVLFLARDARSVEGLSSATDGQLDALLEPCASSMLSAKLRAMLAGR